MTRIFAGLLFLMVFANSFAQMYQPVDTADYRQRKAFIITYTAENDVFVKNLKTKYPGKTGTELAKIYTEFAADFVKQVRNKDFIFTSVFDTNVKLLIERLRKNNPQIPQNLKILVAKDNTPNAYCLADGTFVINMGLFNWLENGDQVASVIAHELGHKIEAHSLKAFIGYIEQNKLDKLMVQSINSDKINKNKKAFDILKSRAYKKSVERRRNEMQADSLGYTIFRKSDFAKSDFVNALKKLQDYDTISPQTVKEETYRKYFGLPGQEFKDKWMKKEDFSVYDYNNYREKLNKDSTASHPEVILRIEKLQKNFPELSQLSAPEKPSETFAKLEHIARMEILPNFFHSEEFGLGIYTSLQFLQENEEPKYYEYWLGRCFEKIYEARKNYNLNRYLDRVDPKNQSESYQQFLSFMWNLSLAEIKNIADFYQNKKS